MPRRQTQPVQERKPPFDVGIDIGKAMHHVSVVDAEGIPCVPQVLAVAKVERISLRGICRAVGVTLKWLVRFLVQCVEALPDHLHVEPLTRHQDVMIQWLAVEADEMSSFVQKKANKQWIWLAMDAKTRQIIAFHVGDRSRKSAKRLWAKIPEAYRQHATFYTDQYVVYQGVIPAVQHRAIHKLARRTNHIERFNNTLRQRVSRLGRDALSFSKKLANHIGAIKLFICHYNLTRAAA
jgi:insertion element IS1 protein InsB